MKKTLFAIFLMLICAAASAQENVTWKYSASNLKNGDVELIFDATIEQGYHLYSPSNPEGASMPLSITLDAANSYSTDGKIKELSKYEEHYEEVFDATERFYNGTARFSITIKPLTAEPFSVSGKIKGQVCNDDYMCQMVRGEFSIPVVPAKPKPANDVESKPKPAESKPEVAVSAETQETAPKPEETKADTTVSADNEPIFSADNEPTDTPAAAMTRTEPATDNGGLWSTFILAFLAGLAAIFTPCVFPMIPMTVSFFLKDKTGKGKLNAIIYGISIVALYTLPVAILILLSTLLGGESFTAGIFNALSTHWLPNIIFFVIFFIFALSFLGMFEIVMPSSIINRAEKRGDKGGLVGIFFLAFVLVLVSFSCTGPIVGSVLVESASGGYFLKPIIAILGFSIAFALPFTLFAFFPEVMKKLPKSGGWMNTMKAILGFVELALGLKFLSVADQTYHWHLLDRETYLAIWIAIGLILTAYLLGKVKLPNDDDMPHIKVPRLILAIITLSFTVYMIPGLWGAPLKALSGYIPPITTQDFVMGSGSQLTTANTQSAENTLCDTPRYADILKLPHGMVSYFDYSEAISCAREQGKPMLLIFTGHGCVNCRKMEENVWSDPRVRQMMQKDFVMCSLFTDDRTPSSADNSKTIGEENTELQIARFQINAQPYYVILDAQTESPAVEPQGYNPDADSFLEYLKSGINKLKQ